MNPYLASSLAYGAAAVAAALLAFAPKDSRADDITIDKTPFVSATTRSTVRADYLKHPGDSAYTEWGSQMNEQAPYKSALERGQARTGFIGAREEVHEYTAEDSGSTYLKSHERRNPASVMGGPAR